MNTDELALFERLYPVLEGLAPQARRKLTTQSQVVHVPQGAQIFTEHQPCGAFPFVLTGAIRVRKSAASGRELPLYRVLPGESCIISSSCLLGRTDYNARGDAELASMLLLLPQPLFEELLDFPVFRGFVFAQFSERMADLMQLIEEVAFRKLDQRLAALLLGKGAKVRATHQQLAEELGSVREIVSRLLKGFADQGMVRLGREQIDILDPNRLRELAS
jgi:CRP/FNR family transcriptional regulator